MAGFDVSSSLAAIVTSFHKSSIALKVLQDNRAEKSRLRKRGKSDSEQTLLEAELANSLDQGSERMRSYYNYYYGKHGEDFAVGDYTAQLKFNEIKEDAKCLYRLFEFAKRLDVEDIRKLRNMADKYQHETQLAMMDLQTRILTHQYTEEPVQSSESSDARSPISEGSSRRDQGGKYRDMLAANQSPTNRSQDTVEPPPPTYFASTNQTYPSSPHPSQPLHIRNDSPEEMTAADVHPALRNQSVTESDRGTEASDSYFSSTSTTRTTPPSSVGDSSPISRQQSNTFGGRKLSSADATPQQYLQSRSPAKLNPDSSNVSDGSGNNSNLGATSHSSVSYFAKSRNYSATSEDPQDPSSSNENINNNSQSNDDSKRLPSRDSKNPSKPDNAKPIKLRNDFCSGALKIQEDPLRNLIVARRPVASYSFANYYGCPRRGCFFEGPMYGAGSHRHMDNKIYTAKCGIQYRWVFLAKSHAPLPSDMRKGKGKGRHGYKCLICHMEGYMSEDVFEGSETLMQHIRDEHTQMMYDEVQKSINCVFARHPYEGEQFDLCITPLHQAAPAEPQEASVSRDADCSDVPDAPQVRDTYEASSQPQMPAEQTSLEEPEKPQEQDPEEFVDLSKAPEVDLLRQLLKACRSPTRVELPEPNAHEHEHPLTSNVRYENYPSSPPKSSLPQLPKSATRGRYRSSSRAISETESPFEEDYSQSLSRPTTRGGRTSQDRHRDQLSPKTMYRVTNPDREEVSDGYASRMRTNDGSALRDREVENTLSVAAM